MKIKIFTLILCLVLCLGALTACESKATFTSNGDGTCSITGLDFLKDKTIVIPETSPDGDRVTSIADEAFRYIVVKNITLPNSLTSIGQRAFYECTNLTSIDIPDSVTSIGYLAFYGCTALESITIGDGVTSISIDAFSGCTKALQEENGVYYADKWVVDVADTVTSVTLRADTQGIADRAFYQSNITSIIIPDGVKIIGEYAFEGCNELSNITIPDSVTSFGKDAFTGCSSSKGLTYIEYDNGKYLGNSDNPYACLMGVIDTPEGSFSIPETTNIIYDGAFYKSNITSITIPSGVTSIGAEAFRYCASLTSITLPDSLTSIGDSAFSDCRNLTSITIPDSVTSIGEDAFSLCDGLTTIIFQGTTAEWEAISKGSDWNSYTGTYTIHCTDGTISKS